MHVDCVLTKYNTPLYQFKKKYRATQGSAARCDEGLGR